MSLSNEQILNILKLAGPDRYKHFIKRVADYEEVWGLNNNGWAMAATSDGIEVFPVWPAKEYAELCAQGDWVDYNPKEISLSEFMGEILPELKEKGIGICVFYTPSDKGVIPEISQLLNDLEVELENY